MPRSCLLAFVLSIITGCTAREESSTSTRPNKVDGDEGSQTFAGLGEWVQVGEVRVRVTGAKVQNVPLVTDGVRFASPDPELMVWVEIENRSPVKTVTFHRWGSGLASNNSATDEHGNSYRILRSDSVTSHIEGSLGAGPQDLLPGDPVRTDIISLERPVDTAREIRLMLCSVQGGKEGAYRFKIAVPEKK